MPPELLQVITLSDEEKTGLQKLKVPKLSKRKQGARERSRLLRRPKAKSAPERARPWLHSRSAVTTATAERSWQWATRATSAAAEPQRLPEITEITEIYITGRAGYGVVTPR